MWSGLDIFQIAGAKARHAAARQALIAENVANADTPGFRAKDLEPFERSLKSAGVANGGDFYRTKTIESLGAASPNGNTVSVEDQMARAASAKRDHEFATTIYAKSLAMLRAALKSGR